MPRQATLRAADRDREAVAERLRHAAVEGRLEPEELEERLDAALRARTYGELQPLLADLPSSSPQPRQRRRPAAMPVARAVLAVAVPVAIAVAVVAAVLVVATLMAAWWIVAVILWFALGAGRGGCCGHRRRRAAM